MAAAAARSLGRDERIDFFRGVALLMIFVNHIPGNPWSLATFRSWGFADSAEIFVLLAGISAALAYGRFFDRGAYGAGIVAVGSRIWTIYLTHLMLFLVLAAICVVAQERFNETSYMEAIGFDGFLQAPAGFIVDVLRLTYQPGYLDILPLYIVLLALLPVLFGLAGRHWALPLVASLVLYAVVHVVPFNLPNSRTAREWFFNPFAWQVLFVLGFTLGRHLQAPRAGMRTLSPLAGRLITTAAMLVVFGTMLVSAPWRLLPGLENVVVVDPASFATVTKTDLHALRLLDLVAKLWLVARFVRADASWLRSWAARRVSATGRHSLEVFALSIVLSVMGGIIATLHGFAPVVVALVNASGLAVLLLFGALLEWRRHAQALLAVRPGGVVQPLAPDGTA